MSYGLYIGKNLTNEGIAYIGGYGDEPSSHYIEVVPRQRPPAGATIQVGVTPEADVPGLITAIPQVEETARNIRVSYSYYKGTPAPLTNGGLNEWGVAVRDIWSPSRPELIEMTPSKQTGPNYSDLARIVLERARTAAGGVRLMGDLIAAHGHTTYGGNSHLIADTNEAWVVVQFAGGQGLWAAERLGSDSIRASRPGYIENVPIDDPASPDFLYSSNLVSFAVSAGWFDPAASTPFNVNTIYGDGKGRWAGVRWIEDEMRRRANRPDKIAIADVMWAVRTERFTGDTAGYGQIVPLIDTDHAAIRHVWHTPIGAVAAPFVPVFLGVSGVPEEFSQHRYLTEGEVARFLDAARANSCTPSLVPQSVEATRSATAVFKRLLYLVFLDSEGLLPEVTTLWENLERELRAATVDATRIARVLLDAGEHDLATRYLTSFCSRELLKALDIGEKLAQAYEIRTRALHGWSDNKAPRGPEQLW
jgi:dipeptidase